MPIYSSTGEVYEDEEQFLMNSPAPQADYTGGRGPAKVTVTPQRLNTEGLSQDMDWGDGFPIVYKNVAEMGSEQGIGWEDWRRSTNISEYSYPKDLKLTPNQWQTLEVRNVLGSMFEQIATEPKDFLKTMFPSLVSGPWDAVLEEAGRKMKEEDQIRPVYKELERLESWFQEAALQRKTGASGPPIPKEIEELLKKYNSYSDDFLEPNWMDNMIPPMEKATPPDTRPPESMRYNLFQNAPQIDSKARTDVSSTAPVPQVGGDVDPNQIGQTETKSGAERYQLWPEKMVRDFATKLSNSKQFLDLYLEGKIAHDDPNLVNAVTTLASTVGNLGLATAPLRTGSVGTFGGTVGWSRTDPQIPELMKRLEKALPDEEITKLTGMWRGVDKKWRFEIPDKDAKLNEPVLKALIDDKPPEGMVSSQGLQYILKHDTLYKFYPELKDYRVEYVKKLPPSLEGAWAYFSKENKTIGITPGFVKLPKSDQTAVLLHEIQHGLQDIEGFAPGGNKTQSKYWRKARELEPWLDKAVKKFHEDRPDKSVPLTDKERAIIAEINEAGRKLQELDDKAFGEYWNLAGEKEARAVEDAYYKSIKILNPKERAKAAAEFQAYINSKKARDPNVPKGWDFT